MVSREIAMAPPERKDMKYKSLGLTVLLAAFAGSALAQTKVSGTLKCGGKPAAEYTVEVGDHPGHVLMMNKDKDDSCTWSVPIEIAGVKTAGHSGAAFTEVNGAKFQERDWGATTMENGDKVYVHSQSTGTLTEDGKTFTYEGTWSWTGGTGKFKGIKGKGTLKGSGTTDGGATTQVEGEYTLPAAGTSK
jgi:hypothetical protein